MNERMFKRQQFFKKNRSSLSCQGSVLKFAVEKLREQDGISEQDGKYVQNN